MNMDKDRKDPTSFLPEEEMSYEIKKKKKKKKKQQEDPFKDIEQKFAADREPDITALDPDLGPLLDPEVTIKVENIEVNLDLNDYMYNDCDSHQNNDTEVEPIVKLEEQNRDAVLLTFESVISEKLPLDIVNPKVEETETTNHFCKVCHLVFKNPKSLRIHQKRKHKRYRTFFDHICDHCGMSYELKSSLAAHLKRKHGPDANKDDNIEHACDICALVFKGSARLRMHMRRKHGSYKERFKHVCQDCGLTYDKECSLLVHRRRKHSGKPVVKSNTWLQCPFCPKMFPRRESYSRHIQRKHRMDNNDDENGTAESKDLIKNSVKIEISGEVTCSVCQSVFSSPMYLKLHMRRKHNVLLDDFRLKCKFCSLSYDKVESLKRHVRRKHDVGTYCEICSKQFVSRELFLAHTHTKVVKECHICGLIFATQASLSKHLRYTHKIDGDKSIFCNICQEGFYQKHQLKKHYMKVHLKVSYTCSICTKTFNARESYKRHLMIKHPESFFEEAKQPYNCEKCTKAFVNEFELCRHINTQHRESMDVLIKQENKDVVKDLFQCTKCPEEYQSWELLREHFEQSHHLAEETQCQKCGQLLPRSELPKHMKSHQESDMSCKYCEFKTKSRISLTQHLLRHKNAETLQCGYNGCRYKTFYEDAMAKHKRRHVDLGVKLQCASCPFQTMNKYILRYHEEAHSTGKKKYMCDKCDYATTLPANLVQHKYKHSTEKRFKCEVCPFATKYNTSLRFHVRKKHRDLPSLS